MTTTRVKTTSSKIARTILVPIFWYLHSQNCSGALSRIFHITLYLVFPFRTNRRTSAKRLNSFYLFWRLLCSILALLRKTPLGLCFWTGKIDVLTDFSKLFYQFAIVRPSCAVEFFKVAKMTASRNSAMRSLLLSRA